MNPIDYTDEILDRRFAMVVVGYADSDFVRSKDGAWGIPPTFTLREARDGLPLPKSCKFWNANLALSKTNCEKLRRLKPGKKVKMSNDQHDYNNWWALRIDGQEDSNLENQIQTKNAELQKVTAEIQQKAGKLLKKQRELQKELRELRRKQTNVD